MQVHFQLRECWKEMLLSGIANQCFLPDFGVFLIIVISLSIEVRGTASSKDILTLFFILERLSNEIFYLHEDVQMLMDTFQKTMKGNIELLRCSKITTGEAMLLALPSTTRVEMDEKEVSVRSE